MSERALFKPVKATLSLTGVTAMNTAITNVLLAKMVFTRNPIGNPSSTIDIFKNVSERIIQMVLDRLESGELTKREIDELTDLANSFRKILNIIT